MCIYIGPNGLRIFVLGPLDLRRWLFDPLSDKISSPSIAQPSAACLRRTDKIDSVRRLIPFTLTPFSLRPMRFRPAEVHVSGGKPFLFRWLSIGIGHQRRVDGLLRRGRGVRSGCRDLRKEQHPGPDSSVHHSSASSRRFLIHLVVLYLSPCCPPREFLSPEPRITAFSVQDCL